MSACFGGLSFNVLSCLSAPESGPITESAAAVPIKKIPQNSKFYNLKHSYFSKFGKPAEFFVRVPGRVNLIGEHTIYCGYPVLPIALDKEILIAARTNDKKELNIKHFIEPIFPPHNVVLKNFEDINIETVESGEQYWYKYILCGVKAALEYLNNGFEHGLDILVDGDLVPAIGLSGSSALVSAACLAFLHAHKIKISKTDIALLCTASEKYVGTHGGGMDQVIQFLGEENSALHITFLPLKATPVVLPDNAIFVVAHCMAEADNTANNELDTRLVECRLAAEIIATCEEVATGSKILTLWELQVCRDSSFEDMIELVCKYLPEENYSKSELCAILNMTEDDFSHSFLVESTKHLTNFKLKQRALHVYGEAYRVESFRKLCSESSCADDNLISTLGNLMSESHLSLKNLYECSHSNLDLLVNLSEQFGVKACLTGYGWGGCIVAICRLEEVNDYMEFLSEEYYMKHCNIQRENIAAQIFATTPNHGAMIYQNGL